MIISYFVACWITGKLCNSHTERTRLDKTCLLILMNFTHVALHSIKIVRGRYKWLSSCSGRSFLIGKQDLFQFVITDLKKIKIKSKVCEEVDKSVALVFQWDQIYCLPSKRWRYCWCQHVGMSHPDNLTKHKIDCNLISFTENELKLSLEVFEQLITNT